MLGLVEEDLVDGSRVARRWERKDNLAKGELGEVRSSGSTVVIHRHPCTSIGGSPCINVEVLAGAVDGV